MDAGPEATGQPVSDIEPETVLALQQTDSEDEDVTAHAAGISAISLVLCNATVS
jgi:hypothetical protein